jgi:hypothetical protein
MAKRQPKRTEINHGTRELVAGYSDKHKKRIISMHRYISSSKIAGEQARREDATDAVTEV